MAYRWKHCSIKQIPLQAPIVSCGLGRLYSKESVLEGLLDRSTIPESAEHIKNLKDVKTLNLTDNPAFVKNDIKNGGYIDDGKSAYICPISGLEMNGKYKFCFLWTCGCVMSERALKEIKSLVSIIYLFTKKVCNLEYVFKKKNLFQTCHNCQKPFTNADVVILNAQNDDLKTMQDNIALRKAEKKIKKRKNEIVDSEIVKSDECIGKKIKKEKQDNVPINKIKANKDVQDPAYKKSKEDYSVAQDPKASEVLKSIFTTHKSAAEQTRAHWVTYNPFYN